MGKKLFISEKPSVASSFGSVLGMEISKQDKGRGYAESGENIITWCYGHLITMAYPDAYNPSYKAWRIEHLPIIPDEYKYIVIDEKGIKKQYDVVSSLMCRSDVELIYCCTDSGREGEYIFRLVYNQSGSDKPVKRVWISSHTDDSVKKGISNAKDISAYDSLSKAAFSRAKEDWLFGMNFSRMYTGRFGRELANHLKEEKSAVIAIGRVMTCVLGLVVERELEIRYFTPKIHYGVIGKFNSETTDIVYKGKWQPGGREKTSKKDATEEVKIENEEKYISKEEAEKVIEKTKGFRGEIINVEIKVKNEQPPLLFNLAELQAECAKKYKIPVDKTLEHAQKLYERKLISYPRTDSRVLSTDVLEEIPKILNGIFKIPEYRDIVSAIKSFGEFKINKKNKRYVDNSKITDHYAIIPTYETIDPVKLDRESRLIYELILRRFLSAFYPPAKYNTVRIETMVNEELFVSNDKTLKEAGWKSIYEAFIQKTIDKKEEDETEAPIDKLKKGEHVKSVEFELEEKETKPPSRYTDGSLILTMEKAGKFIENEELREQIKTTGIGTSATRSGIIKKLNNIGYIDINSKTQVVTPTGKGEAIVEIISKTARELLNPSLTASWEKGLIMIENNETTESVFQEKLYSYIHRTIEKVKAK